MSEYVWSHADVLIADGRWHVRLVRGEAWWATDPLVQARPEFFSATPLTVSSTVGKAQPGITPVKPPARPSFNASAEPAALSPVGAVASTAAADPSQLRGTNPVVESPVQADAPRRGPGRPRRDSRG